MKYVNENHSSMPSQIYQQKDTIGIEWIWNSVWINQSYANEQGREREWNNKNHCKSSNYNLVDNHHAEIVNKMEIHSTRIYALCWMLPIETGWAPKHTNKKSGRLKNVVICERVPIYWAHHTCTRIGQKLIFFLYLSHSVPSVRRFASNDYQI